MRTSAVLATFHRASYAPHISPLSSRTSDASSGMTLRRRMNESPNFLGAKKYEIRLDVAQSPPSETEQRPRKVTFHLYRHLTPRLNTNRQSKVVQLRRIQEPPDAAAPLNDPPTPPVYPESRPRRPSGRKEGTRWCLPLPRGGFPRTAATATCGSASSTSLAWGSPRTRFTSRCRQQQQQQVTRQALQTSRRTQKQLAAAPAAAQPR